MKRTLILGSLVLGLGATAVTAQAAPSGAAAPDAVQEPAKQQEKKKIVDDDKQKKTDKKKAAKVSYWVLEASGGG